MGRLVVTEYVSLDGVFEAPGGGEDFEHAGWTFRTSRGDDGDAFKLAETRATDALLFGRATFDGMAAVWPHRDGEFADRWNELPKFVVTSRALETELGNSHLLDHDLSTSCGS